MTDSQPLIDPHGREIRYLRLSVTDRCDFRCTYCMAEDMTFLPRSQVLSLEELATVARAFQRMGVRKLRVTGGEPLLRKDVLRLFRELGQMHFDDLSLTTNGSRLSEFAAPLVAAGVHRVNISLDSLNAERFQALTRHGKLSQVLAGVRAASRAGFRRIKLNTVLMKHFNFLEVQDLVRFSLDHGLDISFIEEMPLGRISSHARHEEFVASAEVRERLAQWFTLEPSAAKTGGPSRYWQVPGYASRIGFISPHSENFCASCNRVRVSAEGRLLLCLGNEHSADLKQVLRAAQPLDQQQALTQAIAHALMHKPLQHHFDLQHEPQILRFMNATGG